MAAGLIRNIKDRSDVLLNRIKKGIKEEGLKKAKEEALKRAPTPEEIKTKFEDLAQKNPKEAEKYYTNTKRLLEGILSGLESSHTKLQRLNGYLSEIEDGVKKIERIADIVDPYILPAQVFLEAQQAIIVASAAPPIGTGLTPLAIAAADAKRKTLGFISLLVGLVSVAIPIVKTISRSTSSYYRIIPTAIEQIESVISLINKLLYVLEGLYINFLSPLLEGYEEIDGGIETVEDLYNQYPDLETFLTSEGDINLSNEELPFGTTNGISNVPPKFFKRYRKGPYTNIY